MYVEKKKSLQLLEILFLYEECEKRDTVWFLLICRKTRA